MNMIKNCPVTIEYIDIFGEIFGPDIYTLRYKTVRTKPKVVVNDYIGIKQESRDIYKLIELCANIMYI